MVVSNVNSIDSSLPVYSSIEIRKSPDIAIYGTDKDPALIYHSARKRGVDKTELEKLRNKAVMFHQGLVFNMANGISRKLPHYRVKDDLVQDGYLGLMHALDKFEPEKGKFATYASQLIRHEIYDGLRINNTICRTADTQKIINTIKKLEKELNRKPYPEEVKAAIKNKSPSLESIKNIGSVKEVVSFNKSYGKDDSELIKLTPHPESHKSFEQVDRRITNEKLLEILDDLPERQRRILALYSEGLAFTELGKVLGITTEGARQAFIKSLKLLDHPKRRPVLEEIYRNME